MKSRISTRKEGSLVSSLLCLACVTTCALCQQAVSLSDSISKSETAIGYQVGGATEVDLKATGPAPQAMGEAKVEAKKGITNIEIKVKGMMPASKLGTELANDGLRQG